MHVPTIPQAALYPGAVCHPDAWPLIRNIDDVAPHIREDSGIAIFEQGAYLVLRYTAARPETFVNPIDLECRSLIFRARDGALLSRSFHKFFNLGERQGLQDLPLDAAIDIEEKRDGVMIGAFLEGDEILLHTRGGLSGQALAARRAARAEDLELARQAFALGYTPLFEFTSPDHRIVIPYEAQALTLLALRHRETGVYAPELATALARDLGVRRPAALARNLVGIDDVAAALSEISERRDIEGGVLVWPDGRRLKFKARDYHRRHGILARIEEEKNVYLCYLDDLVDDTASALGGDRGRALSDFIFEISRRVDTVSREISRDVESLDGSDRKSAAAEITARYQGISRSAAFAALAGKDPGDCIRTIMRRWATSADKRRDMKAQLQLPDWDVKLQDLR